MARPIPRPENSTRPHTSDDNARPETNPRPNPGRPETGLTRPERPRSRHPPARPVSPFADWTSLSENNELINVDSDGSDNYVPRSPIYEPVSPGPDQEREYIPRSPVYEPDSDPEEEKRETAPGQSVVFDSKKDRDRKTINDLSNRRPRSHLGRETLLQRVSPFLRELYIMCFNVSFCSLCHFLTHF